LLAGTRNMVTHSFFHLLEIASSGRCADGMAALNLATHAGVNFLQAARTSYLGGRAEQELITVTFLRTAMETFRDGDGKMPVKDTACLVAQPATITFATSATNHALKNFN
jgi:hypothetical protein